MSLLIFAATFAETFLIPRRTQLDIIINVHVSSSKVTVIFVRFKETGFSREIFEEILHYQVS